MKKVAEQLNISEKMDQYEKTKTETRDDAIVIPGTLEGTPIMRVTDASKVKNLMTFAVKKINNDGVRQILWTGQGDAVCKVISCAEVMKRRMQDPLHQISEVGYRRQIDVWEPKVEESDLDILRVNRDVPCIAILLSIEPLDENHSGYQPPGDFETFWKEKVRQETETYFEVVQETKESQTKRFDGRIGTTGEERPSDPGSRILKLMGEKKAARRATQQKYLVDKKKQVEGKPDPKKYKPRRIPKSQRPKDYISIDNTAEALNRKFGGSVVAMETVDTVSPGFNPNVFPPGSVAPPEFNPNVLPPGVQNVAVGSDRQDPNSMGYRPGVGVPSATFQQTGNFASQPQRSSFVEPQHKDFETPHQGNFGVCQQGNFEMGQQGDYGNSGQQGDYGNSQEEYFEETYDRSYGDSQMGTLNVPHFGTPQHGDHGGPSRNNGAYQRGNFNKPQRFQRNNSGRPLMKNGGRQRDNFNGPQPSNFEWAPDGDFNDRPYGDRDGSTGNNFIGAVQDLGPPGMDFNGPRNRGSNWRGGRNLRPRGPRGQNFRSRGPRFGHQGP